MLLSLPLNFSSGMKIVFGFVLILFITVSGFGQNPNRPVQPNMPGDIMVDFGFNFLNDYPGILDQKFFPSRSFGVFYQRTFKLSDKFTFHPAIGITNDRFGWDNDVNFQQDSLGSYVFDTLTIANLKKNILTFSYLEVPLELRYYPFTQTSEGEGFFVGGGVIAGVKINAHTKIKYKFDGNNRTIKEKSNFGLNDFRIGYVARIGWKPVNFFYKQYLTDMFQKGPLGSNPVMFTFGLNFTGF